jgi:hypothetical protein
MPPAAARRVAAGRVARFISLIYLLRGGGNAGLTLPTRTFPVSLVLAGPRIAGNAGFTLPIRTWPLSEMTSGFSLVAREIPFTLAIASSYLRSGAIAQTLHVGRELLASSRTRPLVNHLPLTSFARFRIVTYFG